MGFKPRRDVKPQVPKRTPAGTKFRMTGSGGDGPWSFGPLAGAGETVVLKNLILDGNKDNLATAAAESEAELLERRNVAVQDAVELEDAALLWPGVEIGDGGEVRLVDCQFDGSSAEEPGADDATETAE